MNFCDFFTFISYFTLANLVLLCYINGRNGSNTGSSSTVTQHLSMNIGSIRKIASEMKHKHALEGNHDCVVDMIKTFEDPRFSRFCTHLGKTYLTIHEQSKLSSDFESTSMVDLVDLSVLKAYTSFQIYTPEDLIKFIDNAVAELGWLLHRVICTKCCLNALLKFIFDNWLHLKLGPATAVVTWSHETRMLSPIWHLSSPK